MRELSVLFDDACPLCVRCAAWLGRGRTFVPLRLVPARSAEAVHRYGDVPWLGAELVVISDEGEVWAGPAAFLMCLWALEAWREWSYVLATSALAPLAETFFRALSSRRQVFAALLTPRSCAHGACSTVGHGHRVAAYR